MAHDLCFIVSYICLDRYCIKLMPQNLLCCLGDHQSRQLVNHWLTTLAVDQLLVDKDPFSSTNQ